MSEITELMLAAGVVGFLGGFVTTAGFVAWVFWPLDGGDLKWPKIED